MKKKMVAVWALAAVLCFGTATISALAAEGWVQSGSTWVYYDSNGNKIYNTWKKGADNQWRYLNGEGVKMCIRDSSKHPINSVEDMKGLKIRTMTTPIHLEVFEALGANPTPMAFSELFSALQLSLIHIWQMSTYGPLVLR